ncbi:hypothetical protein CEP54_002854 [Fusarium duplospermum]|uniref:Uncharacterized protein n=1 Tax=Fusarium duplospermum TaxID=1325734 RepID=A0A428QSS9_9HYPO|nr:hypothetical protein CEP54_002854 [Fusarium duplospermum]
MYLSAAFMQLLPYRTRHIANTFKQSGSKPLTPSTCNNGRGGQDTGQCLAVPYPDPFFLNAQCQLTVDGHGGSNKKPRQDDDDDNDYPYYPDDYGNNEHNDNNDGKTPDGKRTAKGKEKEEPLYCCAFYKLDPVKHRKCGHLEIKSVAYFLQHIIRQHLLDDKHYHCDNCRTGWRKDGCDSDTLWENHTRAGTCQRVTLEESGKLTPEEHRQLKRKLRERPAGSEFDRWYKIWEQLFPQHKRPDSPYLSNEAEEIEASNVRRLNGVLEEELSQVSPGPERDRMEALARRVIERTFPAHARQGSANAGPSAPRVFRQAPQATNRVRAPTTTTPASAPALRPAGPPTGVRTRPVNWLHITDQRQIPPLNSPDQPASVQTLDSR